MGQPGGAGGPGLADHEPEDQDDEDESGEDEGGEDGDEERGRGRDGHRPEAIGHHVRSGVCDTPVHTVPMRASGRHGVGGSGSRAGVRRGSGTARRPTPAVAESEPPGHGGFRLAGAALLDRLRSTGRARPGADPAFVEAVRTHLEDGIPGIWSPSAPRTGPGPPS